MPSTEDGHYAALTDAGQVGTGTQGLVDASLCLRKARNPDFVCDVV